MLMYRHTAQALWYLKLSISSLIPQKTLARICGIFTHESISIRSLEWWNFYRNVETEKKFARSRQSHVLESGNILETMKDRNCVTADRKWYAAYQIQSGPFLITISDFRGHPFVETLSNAISRIPAQQLTNDKILTDGKRRAVLLQ